MYLYIFGRSLRSLMESSWSPNHSSVSPPYCHIGSGSHFYRRLWYKSIVIHSGAWKITLQDASVLFHINLLQLIFSSYFRSSQLDCQRSRSVHCRRVCSSQRCAILGYICGAWKKHVQWLADEHVGAGARCADQSKLTTRQGPAPTPLFHLRPSRF